MMPYLTHWLDIGRRVGWGGLFRSFVATALLLAAPFFFPEDTRALIGFVAKLGGPFFFIQVAIVAYTVAGLVRVWREYAGLSRTPSRLADVEHLCLRIDHLRRINVQQITAGIACGYFAAIFGGHGREKMLEGFIPLLIAFMVAIPIGISLELLRARGRSLQLSLETAGEAP